MNLTPAMIIFWITCFAIVSNVLSVTGKKDGEVHLKNFGHSVESADWRTLAIQKNVSAAIKAFQRIAGELKNEEISKLNIRHSGVSDKIRQYEPDRKKREIDPEYSSEELPSIGSGYSKHCEDAHIDAITQTKSGNTYAFMGDYYLEIPSNGDPTGKPRRICDDWSGLPGNVDACITWPNGKTYFFKGRHYWSFTDKRMKSGYPKLISSRFEGIPDNLDAAFIYSGNGNIYFFRGDKYWRYLINSHPAVTREYPALITSWSSSIAKGVDAAFQWKNNRTYFFKDNKYYRYNDDASDIDTYPPYPLSTAVQWFKCSYDLP